MQHLFSVYSCQDHVPARLSVCHRIRCHAPTQPFQPCVPCKKFTGHVMVQDAAMREHRERLASAKQKARQLVRHQDVVLTERVNQVERLSLLCKFRPRLA